MNRSPGLAHVELYVDNVKKTTKGRLQSFSVVARRRLPSHRRLGSLHICVEDCGRAYVGNVEIVSTWRDRKLGKALYRLAISYYGELNTRFEEASTPAQRVWLSLINSGEYKYDWQEGTYLCIWPKGQRRRSKCSGNSSS
jgi:hypothetical protein